MRVTVTDEVEDRFPLASAGHVGLQPNLAGAALDLVGVGTCFFRQWRQHPAKLDDIPIPVIPIVEQLKILQDFVNGHGCADAGGMAHIYSPEGRKESGVNAYYRFSRTSGSRNRWHA